MKLVDKHPKIKSGSVTFDEWMRKGKNHINHARAKHIRKKIVSIWKCIFKIVVIILLLF